jgi:copper(I)-binding protein
LRIYFSNDIKLMMIKLKNWVGLCAVLLSLQVNASDITIQEAWIRPLTSGQEDAVVGMVITSARPARIIGVISPVYMSVSMQIASKSGANKGREIGFIELPAQKAVVLNVENSHLVLSGNRQTYGAADKVPVIVTVQFDDQTIKALTIMTQPLGSNVAAQSRTVETKIVAPPPPAPSKVVEIPVEVAKPAKSVAVTKPPVAEVKHKKVAPVVDATPAPVAIVPAPVLAAPVAPAAPVAVPSVAPPVVEPKKALEAKPAEQPKQEEARVSADCIRLAQELRECEKTNEMMQEWCVSSAKSKNACTLSKDQLKKLKN